MKVADAMEKIRVTLCERIESGSLSQAEIGKWLGIDQSQVSRILNAGASLETEKLLLILDALGVPYRLFFEEVFLDEEVEPHMVLYFWRERAGLPVDPFLLAINAPCLELCMVEGAYRADLSPRRQELLGLEDLRFDDDGAAKARLEELAREWVAKATQYERPPGELLGDIAIALSIWASIRRIRGGRDDASKALEAAFSIARLGSEDWVQGLLLQKAAYVLMDLGNARRGIAFLRDAHFFFCLAGDFDWAAKVLVDLGILHNSLGEYAVAADCLEKTFARLPVADQRYRFAAHFALSRALQGLGKNLEAADQLVQASELSPGYPLADAYLKWREGSLALAAREPIRAMEALEKASHLMEACAATGQRILILIDLAEAYTLARKRHELGNLAGRIVSWVKPFRRNKVVSGALQSLALACVKGKVSPKLLAELRQQLEAEFRHRPTHLDPV